MTLFFALLSALLRLSLLGRAALAFAAMATMAMAEQIELLMFEQPGCIYCERWMHDVGGEYPLTGEGRRAPLRMMQLHAQVPKDVTLVAPPVFTPTFVVIKGGIETGRIEGYPGEDFFWPLLADLIAKAEATKP